VSQPTDKVTWDGKPVSEEPPFGATIIVRRRTEGGEEFLLLRRTGAKDGSDWAWTPPSGARLPSEDIIECARRELLEETGLGIDHSLTSYGTTDWFVFGAVVNQADVITLGPEHSEFRWVSLEQAIELCKPDDVAAPFRLLAENEKGAA
jgi:8-oxo-dGTP pyrophosphatase MutT (NUDIX family)